MKQNNSAIIKWLLVLIIGVGIVLRLMGATGDLWLDEVWSLELLASVKSPWEIFTTVCHDNNHILNSLWFWFIGLNSSPFILRSISLILSFGTLYLAARVIKCESLEERLFLLVLVSFSSPLVSYGGEARGYSGLVFFSFLTLHLISSEKFNHAIFQIALFWVCTTLGYLSHRSFAMFLFSVALWRTVSDLQKNGFQAGLRSFSFTMLLPITTFLIIESFRSCNLIIGGASDVGLANVVADLFALTFGFPGLSYQTHLTWIFALLIGILLLVNLIRNIVKQEERSWLYMATIILVPIATVVILSPPFVRPRYFLVPASLSYIPMASFLNRFRKGSLLGAGLVLLLMVGYLFGQSVILTDLIRFGRGGYSQAIQHILSVSTKASGDQKHIQVCGDPDFGNHKILSYYLPRIDNSGQIEYGDNFLYCNLNPEWLIVALPNNTASIARDELPQNLEDKFQIESFYPSGPISGFSWWLLRRKQE